MAIRRGDPPKPPVSVRRSAPKSAKATSKVDATSDAANPDLSDLAPLPPGSTEAKHRPTPSAAPETGLSRAMLQLEDEVRKLDRELGRLLEVFAASDSEAKLWTRLQAQRKRLDDARRRWNRVRRRRRELSSAFQDAPLHPALAARLQSFDQEGSAGERFESISARLAELLSGPEPSRARRLPKSKSSPAEHTVLAELAGAMIDLLRSGEPEP